MNCNYFPSHQKGKLGYPTAAFEITLLESAREVARRKEEAHFRHFYHRFKWAVNRQQQVAYLKSMQLGFTLILTDVSNRIVWTSSNFLSLTGYKPQEILGQTPKLLQGPGTDLLTTRHIGNSVRAAQAVEAELVNYRKNGQAYVCHLAIKPLRTTEGVLTHFLAETIEELDSKVAYKLS